MKFFGEGAPHANTRLHACGGKFEAEKSIYCLLLKIVLNGSKHIIPLVTV